MAKRGSPSSLSSVIMGIRRVVVGVVGVVTGGVEVVVIIVVEGLIWRDAETTLAGADEADRILVAGE